MIEKFLKAKHWQLFLLICGLPMIFQFFLIGRMFYAIYSGNKSNPELMFSYFNFSLLPSILFMALLFAWFWSIGVGLDKKIPEGLKLNLSRFKIFLIIPLIYISSISMFIRNIMIGIINMENEPNAAILILISLLHLFSIFCIFYSMYFAAKTIKTSELQKHVGFGDFAGEYFLIWFFPIGIWFIQPKINKLIEE